MTVPPGPSCSGPSAASWPPRSPNPTPACGSTPASPPTPSRSPNASPSSPPRTTNVPRPAWPNSAALPTPTSAPPSATTRSTTASPRSPARSGPPPRTSSPSPTPATWPCPDKGRKVDFTLPEDLQAYLAELDEFIEREIKPLEAQDDNIRFFDHRREDARTDWARGGLPTQEWEALLAEARARADAAGHYRYAFPASYGGRDGTNLGMAVIREHLAAKGLGLHCDLQNEHAIVGNNVGLLLMLHYGSEAQKAEWADDLAAGRRHFAFGITEPDHGSDATFMETQAERDGDDWVINGEK